MFALAWAGCTFGSGGAGEGSAVTIASRGDTQGAMEGTSGSSAETDAATSSTAGTTVPPDTGGAQGTTGLATDGADGPILTGVVTLGDGDPPVDPPDVDPYGPCSAPCPVPGSACTEGACASPCLVDRTCPLPLSGSAAPECNAPYWDYCDLPCDGGTTCPDGMACIEHRFGASCGWR